MNYSNVTLNRSVNASIDKERCLIIGSDIDNLISLDLNKLDNSVIDALNLLFEDSNLVESMRPLTSENMEVFKDLVEILLEKKILEYKSDVPSYSGFERFDRQILYFSSALKMDHKQAIKCQKKLQNSKVLICGLGGVGGYVFRTLAAMGINNINIVDFDIVEEPNISRQILYDYNDLGKSKVEVALEKVKLVNPSANFVSYNKMIKTESDLMEMSEGVDLIIPTFDEPRPDAFLLANDFAVNNGFPMCFGGSCTRNISVGPFFIPKISCCYRCVNNIDLFDTVNKYSILKTIKNKYTTTLINPINMMAASFISLEAVKFLSGYASPFTLNKVAHFHLGGEITFDTYSVNPSKKCNCTG